MKSKLQQAVKDALRARDQLRLNTIRGVLSEIQYEEMQKEVDSIDETATLAIIQRELKKRREEIDFATQAKREDLLAKLHQEIKVLEGFLPQQLSADELRATLEQLKVSGDASNMGAAMKLLKEKFSGKYDGKIASEVAKAVFG